MPLRKIQAAALSLLASRRNPEIFLGGGVPLNRAGPRTSEDVDVFHDRGEKLLESASADAALLQSHGYAVHWLRRLEMICTAEISKAAETTRIDWVVDSDYRFFPPVPDEDFGFVLHPADIATNKTLAAAGRREPRDAVDLVTIHEQFYPLGLVIWAAVGKDPGWGPENMIAEIRRNARYQDYDLARLEMNPPMTAAELSRKLRAALNEAEAFVLKMPSEKAGLLFLEGGKIVQPNPGRLDAYLTHAGSRGGHWPSSPEIASAMLDAWKTRRS